MAYEHINFPSSHPPPSSPLPSSFTLTCPPRHRPLAQTPRARRFHRSLSLPSHAPLLLPPRVCLPLPAMENAVDQGGLCMMLPQKDGKSKWIKSGIEFYNGAPNVSAVACDRWADWSLAPLPEGETGGVTVGMEREVLDGKATSVLVVYVVEGHRRRHVREVTWVFEDVEDSERECWVGVSVAKPTRDRNDDEAHLEVRFEGLKIETF